MCNEFNQMRSWFEFACSQRPLNHYQLLGLEPFESRPEVIEAAATRITQFLQDLADEPDLAQAEPLRQDVAAAQLCLLGPAKKAAYDAQLRADQDGGDEPQIGTGERADVPEAAPRIKIEATPARSRGKARQAGRRRDSEVFVPPPDFAASDSSDQAAPAPAPPASEVVVPVVGSKRSAAKQPTPRRTSMASRRKTSALSWWITVGVCGISAAAVVALLVYLLGRPPADVRSSALQAKSDFATPDWEEPAEPTEPPTSPQRKRPTTNRSGVRGYSEQEATQRRQGIDSFAAMARTEEERLHRGEPIGLPVAAEPAHIAPPAPAPLAITEGLLAHWSFEDKNPEQAADDSPGGSQAKLDGKPVSIGDGALGAALRFDGRDDCLHVPDGLLRGNAGTIAFWFRLHAASGTKSLVNSSSNSARLQLLVREGRLAGGYGPAADREPIRTEATLRTRTWHHVALTWKSGGDMLLYLDGRPAGHQAAGQLPDPDGILIGKDALSGQHSAFDADEIRLFARPLSAAEVAALVQQAIR